MYPKSLIAVAAVAGALAGIVPASSQPLLLPLPPGPMASEDVMVGLRELCNHGDRYACIRFGVLLGQTKERYAEWRRGFPGWWAWERY